MAREVVNPPREVTDAHTLAAQRYAGYLVGHPYRNVQQSTEVTVDRRRRWKEPAVVADGCLFCSRLTDEEAIRRVDGFQYQIDIEATRLKNRYYDEWINSASPEVPEPGKHSRANLRRFCELFQDMPTEKRPTGWRTRPLPFFKLPLRLKRKLCVEWNHLYIAWVEAEGLEYDFERREFWREVPDTSDPDEGC